MRISPTEVGVCVNADHWGASSTVTQNAPVAAEVTRLTLFPRRTLLASKQVSLVTSAATNRVVAVRGALDFLLDRAGADSKYRYQFWVQGSEIRSGTMHDTKSRQTFSFVAPTAQQVLLVGQFTDWEKNPVALKRNKAGIWTAAVSLPPGKHEYRFLVDEQWCDDPECLARVQNQFGTENCVRIVADAPRRSSKK
jgi:hypothetical protein